MIMKITEILKFLWDETKTLKDNANKFYKLYNKAKTARTKLTELVNESNAKKEYLEQVLYSVESAETIRELQEISGEIIEDKSVSKSNKNQLEIMKIVLKTVIEYILAEITDKMII